MAVTHLSGHSKHSSVSISHNADGHDRFNVIDIALHSTHNAGCSA